MEKEQVLSPLSGESLARMAACAAAAAAVIGGAQALCRGKDIPLWKRYGPWIIENKLQAVVILAAVLYGASLALWPQETGDCGAEPRYTPCD